MGRKQARIDNGIIINRMFKDASKLLEDVNHDALTGEEKLILDRAIVPLAFLKKGFSTRDF